MGDVRIGTCSWSDKTMVDAWYPPQVRSAEARLRYYAQRFSTVEADSPYFALPDPRVAAAWAARTPPGFVFHVKAYGLMTQHAVLERSLHPALRELEHEVDARGRVRHPSPAMLDASFALFRRFVEPLRAADKLGGVLMQFPPYFTAMTAEQRNANLGYIDRARELLSGLPVLVEFRHPSWVAEDIAASTLRFLADRGLAFVSVDAPQFADRSTMPPVSAVTAPWAYVRLHGRNRATYFAHTTSAAERFDYRYSHAELEGLAPRIRELASQAQTTWVMFNNCQRDYAPSNARELGEILGDLVAEVPHADEEQLDLGV